MVQRATFVKAESHWFSKAIRQDKRNRPTADSTRVTAAVPTETDVSFVTTATVERSVLDSFKANAPKPPAACPTHPMTTSCHTVFTFKRGTVPRKTAFTLTSVSTQSRRSVSHLRWKGTVLEA